MVYDSRLQPFSLAAALLIVACCSVGQAQTVEWSRQLGTTASDIGYGISADGLGNIYVSGRTNGVLGDASAGAQDAFVSKYNSSGTLQWTQQLGTTSNDVSFAVSADGLGNVYISGQTDGILEGLGAGDQDAFVTKYDSSGVFQWTRQFGTDAIDGSFGVSADGLGNVYVSGLTGGDLEGSSEGEDDAFLRKYNSSGTVVWTRQLGTSAADRSNSVSADKMGNIYVSGFTNGDLDGTNAGDRDAFVAKYDTTGALQWTRQFGTSKLDDSLGVSSDGVGNVYVAGKTVGSLAGTHAGGADVFVAKYDSSGNLQWTRQIGDTMFDAALGVSADNLGNVYVSGYTNGVLGDAAVGDDDVFVSKYNSYGTHQWTHQYGTTVEDISNSVSTDGRGQVYVTGQTTGDLAGPALGARDVFVSKLVEPAITYTHLDGFLSSIAGEQLESFETQTATDARDTMSISTSTFDVQSTANMGVWGQPPADFEGTHPTNGDNWLVAPTAGDVTFTFQPHTKSFAAHITDYGDDELVDDLSVSVSLEGGTSLEYTIANPGGSDGNEIFWGLESVTSPISSVTFSINGTVGFDQIYTSLVSVADFDFDGDVDTDDLAQWEGDFGLNGDSDADGDGDSDGIDFLIWQRLTGDFAVADFDHDGDVDGVDFLKWQRGESPIPLSQSDLAAWEANYGTVAPLSATSTAVPEPATLGLVLIALVVFPLRGRCAFVVPE